MPVNRSVSRRYRQPDGTVVTVTERWAHPAQPARLGRRLQDNNHPDAWPGRHDHDRA